MQAARMTGHSLDVFTRHYAGDYAKAQPRRHARVVLVQAIRARVDKLLVL